MRSNSKWWYAALAASVVIVGCRAQEASHSDRAAIEAGAAPVASPDGRIVINVAANSQSAASYRVSVDGREVVADSALGLTFVDGGPLGPARVVDVVRSTRDSTYEMPVGKTSSVRDHYNAATLTLEELSATHRRLEIDVRAYDDGVAFRYRIPEQSAIADFAIESEATRFSLPAKANAWVLPLPGLNDHYEYYYDATTLERVKSEQLVGLPLLMQLPEGGGWAAITEANLTDYAGMGLLPDADAPGRFRATLAPPPNASQPKVHGRTPFVTPWRVVMLADQPGRLIESNLLSNLNEPCAIQDTSWIKPGKVSFLWWNGYVVGVDANGKPIRGGVDTKTCIQYVDFAADNGIPYASLDGLDVAWYGGPLAYKDQDLTTGHAPNLDVQAVLAHAKARGVRIRLWMDSKALWPQLDKALDAFEKWGVEGLMIDFIQREDQENVRFFEEVVRKAAAHHLTITLHNVPKPTGLSRTWPNLMTFEAVRNEEWNKWSPGATPAHQVTVPFTRMLAGPLDFHSGGFRSVVPREFKPVDVAPVVIGTRAHQVAMYVVYEDPLPMVVDYPDAYRDQPGFRMMCEIPTSWDETRVLAGEVGKFITIARRKGDTWYVGSMNGDDAREYAVPLTFLDKGGYELDGWRDGADDEPNKPIAEEGRTVRRDQTLKIAMQSAGGHIVRLRPVRH